MNNRNQNEQNNYAQSTALTEWRADTEKNLLSDSDGGGRTDSQSQSFKSQRLSIHRDDWPRRDPVSKSRGAVAGGIIKQLIEETYDELKDAKLKQKRLESRLQHLHILLEELSAKTEETLDNIENQVSNSEEE